MSQSESPAPEPMRTEKTTAPEGPAPGFFAHSVMVVFAVQARSQDEANAMIQDSLDELSIQPAAVWEHSRTVVAPRKGWGHNVY